MIVFIGAYPSADNEKDGMVQRVGAIDRHYHQVKRVYLDIGYRQHFKIRVERPAPHLLVLRLNLLLHLPVILYFGFRARRLYVHSIYNAIKVLYLYPFKPVITDMHGVVPEELKLRRRPRWAFIFGLVERYVLSASTLVITVTQAMTRHFQRKYGDLPVPVIVLPIITPIPGGHPVRDATRKELCCIYSGGTQAWQNIDRMIDAMARMPGSCHYLVLTGNAEAMSHRLQAAGLDQSVEVQSVPQEQVFDYYAQADLGFVLRDDDIINQVACPTKLAEYLGCGVIPVVLQPRIGDFHEYGFAYLLLEDLLQGRLPGPAERERMRHVNYTVMEELQRVCAASIRVLTAA